jgi:hypothetical protein
VALEDVKVGAPIPKTWQQQLPGAESWFFPFNLERIADGLRSDSVFDRVQAAELLFKDFGLLGESGLTREELGKRITRPVMVFLELALAGNVQAVDLLVEILSEDYDAEDDDGWLCPECREKN